MSFRARLLNYFCQRDRGWTLSLLTAICVVYLPFLGSPFVFDDLPFFFNNAPDYYANSLVHFDLRWLPYASLRWTTTIFSDVFPHPFRLGNILLHIANVILLLYLLRRLVSAVISGNKDSPAVTWGAWFGALFFAIHPVAVYAVGYVVERSILMATFFSLFAQLAYCRGLLTGQKRWLLLAAGAYFLACFSKEHSVMVPALLGAQTILLRGKNQAPRTALWVTWGAFAAIAIFVVLRAKWVFGVPYEVMAADLFKQQGIVESTSRLHLLSVLTQAGLFFKYLLLWCLPDPAWMSVDMRESFASSLSLWWGWFGAASFALYGFIAFRLLLRPRWTGLAGLALLYPWLQFVLEFSSIRMQEPFVLYRSYMWLPGMMLFFPLLLAKPDLMKLLAIRLGYQKTIAKSQVISAVDGLPSHRMLIGLGFVVLLLVPLAWNRLWVFVDNYRLWNDAALLLRSEREPGADRIFYNRGQAEAAAHNWGDAITDFQRAVALSPQLAPVRYALGLAYFNAGRYQDALAEFDAAIILKSDEANFYYAKGVSLKRLHQDEKARQQIEKSCELKNLMACMIVAGAQSKK